MSCIGDIDFPRSLLNSWCFWCLSSHVHPFRKTYPCNPKNNHDITNALSGIMAHNIKLHSSYSVERKGQWHFFQNYRFQYVIRVNDVIFLTKKDSISNIDINRRKIIFSSLHSLLRLRSILSEIVSICCFFLSVLKLILDMVLLSACLATNHVVN